MKTINISQIVAQHPTAHEGTGKALDAHPHAAIGAQVDGLFAHAGGSVRNALAHRGQAGANNRPAHASHSGHAGFNNGSNQAREAGFNAGPAAPSERPLSFHPQFPE